MNYFDLIAEDCNDPKRYQAVTQHSSEIYIKAALEARGFNVKDLDVPALVKELKAYEESLIPQWYKDKWLK